MARVVKDLKHAARRKDILDVAQRLVVETKGYEGMSIQNVLDELRISKGAFYHYFDSKGDLLEALIERMVEEAEPLLIEIVQDTRLPALEKLQSFFDRAARWKTARKSYLLALLRIWYADENAIVRDKLRASAPQRFGPLLTEIIRQGIREGVLTAAYPDQAGAVVLSLVQELGDNFARMLLDLPQESADMARLASIVAAYTDAIEHVLGAPAGSLTVVHHETISEWFEPAPSPVAA
jgi:AcrR family transcriptional regulator